MKCKNCGMEIEGRVCHGRHESPEHCIEALGARVEELEAQVKALTRDMED